MRNSFSILAAATLVSLMAAGCAGPEKKLGRGMCNTLEIVRLGEVNRSTEQTALFGSPDRAHTTGFVRGLDRTLARTGLGLYEIVTFPIPPYQPTWTSYLSPNPAYPDAYKPGVPDGPAIATDSKLGFSGGEILPWVPGSRFRIFDNQ